MLVPCYNEEAAVGNVVRAFARELPYAQIYVYDNNSTDRTADVARAAGAQIGREQLKGKGHVIRRMFADIDADAYVLVDGDDTYDASSAQPMVDLLFESGLDMVTGTRITEIRAAYRTGHRSEMFFYRHRDAYLREPNLRYAVRLSGVQPTVRQELPCAECRLRDRDRVHHPRA